MRGILISTLVLLMTAGCEEEKTTNLGGIGGPCDLNLDAMTDTTWVMDRINPDRSTEPDHKTRLRFWQEGDVLKANYNVNSIGDMYTYSCERRKRDLYCLHDLDEDFVYRTCASMEVQGVGCTPEKIRERAPHVSAEHLEAGVASRRLPQRRHLSPGNDCGESSAGGSGPRLHRCAAGAGLGV